ncbi:Hypothetical protein POVR2_LOCUS137 [uncultured virus]|nr:Hypothetical protein POVR2_LOCUS137 [uncultured virus]
MDQPARSIEVRWNGKIADQVRDALSPTLQSPDLILEVADGTVLTCDVVELINLLTELASREFNMVELSDFSSVAVLYNRKKNSSANLIVKPAPFKRAGLNGDRHAQQASNGTLIKRQKGSSISAILAAAFAFFVIIVLGIIWTRGRAARRR